MKQLLIGLPLARAGLGFGWCSSSNIATPTQDFDFDPAKFQGEWFEVQKDAGDQGWKNQMCVTSNYKLSDSSIPLVGDVTFDLQRTYRQNFLFWQFDEEKTDMPIVKNKKGIYELHESWISTFPHQVVVTDYDNWAVVYGCKDYILPIYYNYATLLSRHSRLEGKYVDEARRAAKSKANYDYTSDNSGWVSGCEGWTLGRTIDEIVHTLLSTTPDWSAYNTDSNQTMQVRELFESNNDHIPFGKITGPLTTLVPNEKQLSTPISKLLFEKGMSDFFILKGIIQDSYNYNSILDIWIGVAGLDQEQLDKLKLIQTALTSGVVDNLCCFDFQQGSQFHIAPLLSGFGRIVKYNKDTKSIIEFREGEFQKGTQVGFGRFSIQEIETDQSFEQVSFTGWIPSETTSGKGFVTLNQFLMSGDGSTKKVATEWHQGGWDPTLNWGSSIQDFKDISSVFIVDSFSSQPL